MNINKFAFALVTFTCITFSSAIYIAKKEVTSAVLVDKAMHSIDMPTNGLYNLSIAEAFAIDKSETAQINFLRCSFARPEFRFSWFCHQTKIDGKMTKQSYAALKADQEKYFRDNVFRSFIYEAEKLMIRHAQLSIETAMNHHQKGKVTNTDEYNEKYEHASVIARDVQNFNEKYKAQYGSIDLKEIEERFIDSESPVTVSNYDPKQHGVWDVNIDVLLKVIFILAYITAVLIVTKILIVTFFTNRITVESPLDEIENPSLRAGERFKSSKDTDFRL